MKLYIYITDMEQALKGNFTWSLNISSRDDLDQSGVNQWTLVTSVDIDLNLDREEMTKIAVANVDAKIEELRAESTARITRLEGRKQELLAITDESA